MADQLDAAGRSLDAVRVANVAHDVLDVDGRLAQIEHGGLETRLERGLDDVRADEAGTTGHEHTRHVHTVRPTRPPLEELTRIVQRLVIAQFTLSSYRPTRGR